MRATFVIQKLGGIRGGAERVVVDLARALATRGHEITIATYETAAGPDGYDTEHLTVVDLFPRGPAALRRWLGRDDRVDSTERMLSQRGNRGVIAQAKWHATHGLFARRLTGWLRTHPQDAVVGFLPPAISAVALARRSLGSTVPKVIASTHNVPSIDFGDGGRWDQNPVARRTNLWALGAVDAVTVLQPDFVSELPEDARPNAVVMPNAVTRLTPPSDHEERHDLVLGVGRLTDVKRYDVLIRAFARLAPDFPTWSLMICGEGPERPRLERLVAELRLEDRISLPGSVVDIGAVYDTGRILGHSAAFEGFGLSVAEAILHDLVVVASASCSGVSELVEAGSTGVLVDEHDDAVGAFERGLRAMMVDPPSDEDRRAGARRLAQTYHPDHIVDAWEQLLRP